MLENPSTDAERTCEIALDLRLSSMDPDGETAFASIVSVYGMDKKNDEKRIQAKRKFIRLGLYEWAVAWDGW